MWLLGLALVVAVASSRSQAAPPWILDAWIAAAGGRSTREQLSLVAGPIPIESWAGRIAISPDALQPLLPCDERGRYVGTLFLIGHECGHDPRHRDDAGEELRADEHAGGILRSSGVTIEEIDRAIVPMLGTEITNSHGDPALRRLAILKGWTDATPPPAEACCSACASRARA